MPFAFTFYGTTSRDLRVGHNGGILFNQTSGNITVTNQPLPDNAHPLAIFPFWDDLTDDDTSDVYIATVGTAPNRQFIVQWHNRPHFAISTLPGVTFQVVLYEATGQIDFVYEDIAFGDSLYDWPRLASIKMARWPCNIRLANNFSLCFFFNILTNEDEAVAISVLDNDSDVDGDSLSLTSVGSALSGTTSLSGHQIVYTPTPDFHGRDTFTYTLSDGNGGTAVATVTVTVVDEPPVAVDDEVTSVEDMPVTISVLDNDSDVDGDSLSLTSVGSALTGTTSLSGHQVVYTPTPDFHGRDTFTYTLSDSNGSTAVATVTVIVNPVNDAPVAVDDTDSTAEDTP